jgi:hypothetical protein
MAIIGEDDTDRTVMAKALDHNLSVIGADDLGTAKAHAAGFLDGTLWLADITLPAATTLFKPVPAIVAAMVTNDDAIVVTAEREFEADATGIGGGGGSGDAGGGDNEGGEGIADEGVHDCSPDLRLLRLAVILCLERLSRSIDPTLAPPT